MSPEDEISSSPSRLIEGTIKTETAGMNERNLNKNGGPPPTSTTLKQNGTDKSKRERENGHAKNGTTNGHHHKNGNNGISRVPETRNGDNKKDLTYHWTPLLEIPLQTDDNGILYGPPTSNNNEWKESEEINNLRNNMHKIHSNNNTTNNNGSIINGKNGFSNGEKLGIVKNSQTNHFSGAECQEEAEQDPLTGRKRFSKRQHSLDSCSGEEDPDNSSDSGSRNNGKNYDKDDENSSSCGIFGFYPKWARNLASTHMFMFVFLLAWVLQGMYLTYFVSVITTIEKLFQIKSKTTGMLMSASEIGQISTALLLTHFAGRGHRPRWIAVGMVIFAIASFSCSLPHFIFGKELMQSSALFINPNTNNHHTARINSNLMAQDDMTKISHLLSNGSNIAGNSTSKMTNDEDFNLCLLRDNLTRFVNETECEEDVKMEQASHSKITVIVLCIFFVSLLSSGIGQTAVSTLGIPYIDDNVASKESPIYLAITIGVRILGPATGFIVGSFCTRIYVDLSNPGIDPTDPRWISAWWLGPVLIGTLMMISSIAMFTFPKQLRGNRIAPPPKDGEQPNDEKAEDIPKPSLRDFPKTVRRQLSNDILMFRTASSVFHLLPIAGLYTFLPKYLETQFRLPAADANLITAFGGILVMGVGIVISGIVILKTNPTARWVAGWIAFTALIYSCGMMILMFVGCDMNDFAGLSRYNTEKITKFEPTCNVTCSCDLNKFSPICGEDGMTYFSSCHAGCSTSEIIDGKRTYSNCDCIPDLPQKEKFFEAINGYCDGNCKNFIFFICIFAFCVFIHSTSEVGSMLLIMRCTDPKDKAMAMGVIQSAVGLFGNVPCPIIYGAVVDSACLVWKTVCGKPGACSLYDIELFRHYFLGITAGIMFIAFIMDLIVWHKSHRIDIAPSDSAASSTIVPETECEKPALVPESCV